MVLPKRILVILLEMDCNVQQVILLEMDCNVCLQVHWSRGKSRGLAITILQSIRQHDPCIILNYCIFMFLYKNIGEPRINTFQLVVPRFKRNKSVSNLKVFSSQLEWKIKNKNKATGWTRIRKYLIEWNTLRQVIG